jgi:DNA polymerase-3 subunit delta
MAEHSVATFKKYLEKTLNDNLILITGEERFFYDQIINAIENNVFINKADKDLNHHLFYGGESSLSDILSTCLSYPMFTKKKLIIIKEFENLQISDTESLIKYIENPQTSTILVLVAERLSRNNLNTKIQNKAVTIKCNRLNERDIFQWTTAQLKEFNIDTDKESIAFLVENIGTNLLRLSREIEKIKNFLNPGQKLTIDLISKITGFTREVNIFNLQKVLASKDLKSSLKIGSHLLEQGEVLAGIIPVLFIFFRRMWVVKELQSKNYGQRDILNMLSGNPYAYREIFNHSQDFDRQHIELIFGKFLEAEVQLKTSQKSPESILTILCYFICNFQKI